MVVLGMRTGEPSDNDNDDDNSVGEENDAHKIALTIQRIENPKIFKIKTDIPLSF